MCGRYVLRHVEQARKELARLGFRADALAPLVARYNISPSQLVPVVAAAEPPAARLMRWGFVPPWEKSAKPALAPVNARSEDALTKPMFRSAVQHHRCVLPADGYYEWHRRSPTDKQPYCFALAGDETFFIAGLHSAATDLHPETCALLTCGPNELTGRIHDRMPVILTAEALATWLRPGPLPPEAYRACCRPFPATRMRSWPVSTLVNKPAHDTPDCVVPVLVAPATPPDLLPGLD